MKTFLDKQLIVPEYEYQILTPQQDIMSGYKEEVLCKDDPKWNNGDKKCIDYSFRGSDCTEKNSEGVSALNACRVSCDNCPGSVHITKRKPSPMEDVEEPDYAVFEDGFDESGDSEDYRFLYDKLDELDDKTDDKYKSIYPRILSIEYKLKDSDDFIELTNFSENKDDYYEKIEDLNDIQDIKVTYLNHENFNIIIKTDNGSWNDEDPITEDDTLTFNKQGDGTDTLTRIIIDIVNSDEKYKDKVAIRYYIHNQICCNMVCDDSNTTVSDLKTQMICPNGICTKELCCSEKNNIPDSIENMGNARWIIGLLLFIGITTVCLLVNYKNEKVHPGLLSYSIGIISLYIYALVYSDEYEWNDTLINTTLISLLVLFICIFITRNESGKLIWKIPFSILTFFYSITLIYMDWPSDDNDNENFFKVHRILLIFYILLIGLYLVFCTHRPGSDSSWIVGDIIAFIFTLLYLSYTAVSFITGSHLFSSDYKCPGKDTSGDDNPEESGEDKENDDDCIERKWLMWIGWGMILLIIILMSFFIYVKVKSGRTEAPEQEMEGDWEIL